MPHRCVFNGITTVDFFAVDLAGESALKIFDRSHLVVAAATSYELGLFGLEQVFF